MQTRNSLLLSLVISTTLGLTAGNAMFAQRPYSSEGSTAQAVNHTSDATFEKDVLEAKTPVVVDFYATWCGSCRKLSPVIESVSRTYSDKIAVYKVDVDKNPRLAESYGITSIPAIKIFKKGKLVDSAVGLLSESQLKDKVDKLL